MLRSRHARSVHPSQLTSVASALTALVLLAGALAARAEPISPAEVPEPLRPWIGWVLWDAPAARCPRGFASDTPVCRWIPRLELSLDAGGGSFRENVVLFSDGWVPLPGDAERWPEQVDVDGRGGVVLARDGVPSLRLGAGRYRVSGRFRWSTLPDLLAIPPEAALVALELRGSPVPFPERASPEQLWLTRERPESKEESRLDVSVHRLLSDDVPLALTTQLELRVSGAPREVVWRNVLPEGFVPMSLETSLPARLEADGSLRVQVRPGTHTLELEARGAKRAVTPRAPQVSGPWDADEVWVFQARPELRSVDVEGASSVDPQQTQLPDAWRTLPAYLLTPGTELRLVERTRGDAEPTPDRLRLARTLWLDFDGGGYSLRDVLSGALTRSWRLEMRPPIRLGRVAIDDVDQPITRLEAEGADGVELRRGELTLTADARLDASGALPAVGWSGDVEAASAELRLPPGWTALHVSGVDRVRGTWLDAWSLLQLFLVLIGALAIAQLFGAGFGALALLGFALIFPEPDAPRYVWLAALAVQALARVAPAGRMPRALRVLQAGTWLLLAFGVIPFAAQQARQALHPSLEQVEPSYDLASYTGYTTQETSLPAASPPAAAEPEAPKEEEFGKLEAPGRFRVVETKSISVPVLNYFKPDPNAVVSTGPGIPSWTWRRVGLEWSGPVTAAETLRPWLVPPWANQILSALRVALCAALALVALGRGGDLRRLGALLRPGASGVAGALALCALWPGLARADLPSAEQLAELRARLLARPECAPDCAASALLEIEIEPAQLRARMNVDVAWPSAVPLPGALEGFTPQGVLIDEQPATALRRGEHGVLFVQLERGRHDLRIVGALPDRDSVVLPLPLPPRRVQISARGWTVSGLRPDGRPTDSLQLTRERQSGGLDAPGGAGASEVPPFLRVVRTLRLGLAWQIETRIQRVTPPGRPLVASIPLLEGEAVTAEGVETAGGRAQFTLGPQVQELSWTSILAPRERILLRAEESALASERWSLDAAPFWHVEPSGIPAIATAPGPLRVREWQPWPGEEVALGLTRPGSAPGQSATIDRSELRIAPGARYASASLTLGVRASRGMRQVLTLPAGAELEEVTIDGQRQTLRLSEGKLELQLRPGAQEVHASWRAPGALGLAYATPPVDLGLPSVNASVLLEVPRDRWILWTSGPRLGPAVLFWGLLAVAGLLALGLGRVELTPLGAASWFLLFIGLTQVHLFWGALVVAWLLALGLRGRSAAARRWLFNLAQIQLALLTLVAFAALWMVIDAGLLGPPEMQIAGNDSSGSLLRWYQDRAGTIPAAGHALWVPAWLYRVAMLAWAVWLATALLGWLRWGWGCFSHQGVWHGRQQIVRDSS